MTPSRLRFLALAPVLALLLAAPPAASVAQDAPENPEAQAPQTDPEIGALIETLVGSYSNGEYTLRIAEVYSPPLDRPLYVELVRLGFEDHPERQQVWWIHKRSGEVFVRINTFPRRQHGLFATNFADLAVGMWAAPEFFPRLRSDDYEALGDLRTEVDADGARMWSEHPFPIAFGGAYTTEAEMRVTPEAFTWLERGRGLDNEIVWGEQPIEMERLESTPRAVELPSGLRYIDLRVGRGPELREGHMIALHYKGWMTTGMIIDDTKVEGRKILTAKFPLNAFPGFNEGLRGMTAPEDPKNHPPHSGSLRRVLIPPHMAFGEQGSPPVIPPNAPLIFNFDLQSILTTPSEQILR